MRLICYVFLGFVWLWSVQPLSAQGLADLQPSYTRIAAGCGEDPSSPSYSSADYAQALADAAKALKSATKEGNRPRITAITNSVTRLQECMVEETRKFVIPPINNCADFLIEYNAFTARAALLLRQGKVSAEDVQRYREMFRKPAMDCVRHIMQHCIDPSDTRTVDFVIAVMQAASHFGFIKSYANTTGLEWLMITKDPTIAKMTFCTDTDYSCRGDPVACSNRTLQIKAIMQTYMN